MLRGRFGFPVYYRDFVLPPLSAPPPTADVIDRTDEAEDDEGKGLEEKLFEVGRPALVRVVGRLAAHARDH